MEEHDVDDNKEKRQSLHSVNSAVEAMQRAADRLIATTESFRVQFRERQDARLSQRETEAAILADDGADSRPPTVSNDASRGGADQDQPMPFTTTSSDRTTSSRTTGPQASHPSSSPGTYPAQLPDDLPVAASPSTPHLVDAITYPEPTAARIESSMSSEASYATAQAQLSQPTPAGTVGYFQTPSPGQYYSMSPNSPGSSNDVGSYFVPRYPPYRSSTSALREPLSSGTDGHVTLASGKESTKNIRDERPSFSFLREVFFVFIICFSQLLMFAAFAQALAPAQKISESFPDTVPGYQSWYSAAFGIGVSAFALPAGRLGSLLGHKKVFIAGFAWLSLWSTLAGLSIYVERGDLNGTVFFCVCRAMQGMGPAVIVPNAQALLGRVYDLGPRRNLVMCLFGAAAPLGFVAGAVMASLFVELMSWEWAFFVLGAVCLTLACQSIIVLPADVNAATSVHTEKFWRLIDAPGIITGVSGIVLFTFAWNQAPVVSWTTPYVYFMLIISILLIGAFLYIESAAQYPLLPISAMTTTTHLVLACTAAGWGCFAVWVYYTFQFIVVLREWDPLLASAGFAHIPVVGLLATILVAYLLRRITPYWVLLISTVAFAIGATLMATAPVQQSYWINAFLSILFIPLGMNMSSPVATVLVTNSMPHDHQGIAGSFIVTAVFSAISVGLGMAGTVASSVNDEGRDILAGYRGAFFLALGLAGLGIMLALISAISDTLWPADPEEGAVLRLRIGTKKGQKAVMKVVA
ncbi:hypothetical protein jhhlp_005693 [Lomentospora prolificans]|uniref:Major facilitator superfamily (MFS) profile domain-containing protein n=1 Tax=Lomentospora prolificans TaxID=41688 RepID=A0A2N3N3T8_9PEZI|nr:hypothetical protein jhhlp_005693 [Lomentospora prolificans]